jgi:hypothetical protein
MCGILLWVLFLAPPSFADRRPDLPEFSHSLMRIDKLRFSIKLPKGTTVKSLGDDEIIDGNADKGRWLWGRVIRADGRWLNEQIQQMQLAVRCGGTHKTAVRKRIKSKFLTGYAVSCGSSRSHVLIDESFAAGWIKVWANSRKTNSHYTMEFQTTEVAHEEHVQEVLDNILWSLKEPKELWLEKPKKKKKGFKFPWPRRRKHRRSGERFEGDETIFIR